MNKQEKSKWHTLTELSKIDGAFDVGKRYKCVKSDSFFVINKIYTCNGMGVVFDERGGLCASGGVRTMFEPVEEPKIYWNGDGKPKVGEIVGVNDTANSGLVVYVGRNYRTEVCVVQFPLSLSIIKIDDIKPVDMRTDKEKAVDDILMRVDKKLHLGDILSFVYDKWVGDKK